MKEKKKCFVKSCEKISEHNHHVTYKPPMLRPLCRIHHEDITIVNTNWAWRIKKKLSTEVRKMLWEKWLKGEIHPERTPEALAWISKWRKPRKVKLVPDWSARSERMNEEMFNTGLTHGEARRITDNARKHMRMSPDDADGLATCLLSDANWATALDGEMAKAAERNLREGWALWWLGAVRHPWMFGILIPT